MTISNIKNASAITAVMLATSPVFAGNVGESLVSCYNHVIQACSQAENPYCTSGGLDACDELHTAQMLIPGYLLGKVNAKRAQAAQLVRKAQMSIPTTRKSVRKIPMRGN
jgi:hypothetical protein